MTACGRVQVQARDAQGRTRAHKGARGHTMHQVMGAHGRDKLNHEMYEQIEYVVSLHKSPHLCKKDCPKRLTATQVCGIISMWSRERRKYEMRRGRIKNRDKIDPLNKNPPNHIKPQYHRDTLVIIIII